MFLLLLLLEREKKREKTDIGTKLTGGKVDTFYLQILLCKPQKSVAYSANVCAKETRDFYGNKSRTLTL